MTYALKLKDPRWQKLRLQIMERDGFRCVICGDDKKTLNVHHVIYKKRNPWDYPEYLYQTLCEDCHKIRGELTDKAVDALRIAIAKIPTERLLVAAQRLSDEAMMEIEPDPGAIL